MSAEPEPVPRQPVALVTGATSGIGRAIALKLASDGFYVIVHGRDASRGNATVQEIESNGGQARFVSADLTAPADIAHLAADAGAVDVLVNNAGLERLTPIRSSEPAVLDIYQRIIDINVNGSFWVTHATLPYMKRGGKIIFTASIWGKSVEAEFAAYCASKHAIIGLTRVLARELGPDGINVNAVCPGWVRTEASMRSLRIMAERSKRPEPELLDEIVSGQAIGGLMEPKDIAGPYLFLASDAAANITGQALNIDRGEVMI